MAPPIPFADRPNHSKTIQHIPSENITWLEQPNAKGFAGTAAVEISITADRLEVTTPQKILTLIMSEEAFVCAPNGTEARFRHQVIGAR